MDTSVYVRNKLSCSFLNEDRFHLKRKGRWHTHRKQMGTNRGFRKHARIFPVKCDLFLKALYIARRLQLSLFHFSVNYKACT